MAIIKFGALISGLRGSVGGVVFSAGHAGPFARLSYRPPFSRSHPQSSVRAQFSRQPGNWRSLSDAQKNDWSVYAADPDQVRYNSLGEAYNPSSFNCYFSCNAVRALVGLPTTSAVPTYAYPPIPTIDSFSAALVAGPVFETALTCSTGTWSISRYLIVECAYFPRGGRTVAHSGFYFMLSGLYAPNPSNVDFGPEFMDKWGLPIAGDQLFVRVSAATAEGRRSAYAQAYAIVS